MSIITNSIYTIQDEKMFVRDSVLQELGYRNLTDFENKNDQYLHCIYRGTFGEGNTYYHDNNKNSPVRLMKIIQGTVEYVEGFKPWRKEFYFLKLGDYILLNVIVKNEELIQAGLGHWEESEIVDSRWYELEDNYYLDYLFTLDELESDHL